MKFTNDSFFFLNTYQGGINEAKTSDKDKLSEIPYRYIPPYFFKDKLGPSGEFLSLLQSALKNNVDSQHRLSNMYFDGIKVEKDHLAGYWWLLRAANNGYRYSWLIMADMLSRFNYCYRDIISRDKYKAVQWYRKYNSRIYLIQCYKERYNVFLSNQDRSK
jgi:TPR repeat protein